MLIDGKQLRQLLAIPATQEVLFERYSDSAGAFIALDSNNSSVYKQLYRAAKAKLKLRIKASIIDSSLPKVEVATPDLVSPDHLTSHRYVPMMKPSSLQTEQVTSIYPLINNNSVMMSPVLSSPKPIQAPREELEQFYPRHLHQDVLQKPYRCSVPNLLIPKTSLEAKIDATIHVKEEAAGRKIHKEGSGLCLLSGRQHFIAENEKMKKALANSGHPEPKGIRLDLSPPALLISADQPVPVPGSKFTICCNSCDTAIPADHWHCSICDNGDFDLCSQCVDKGVLCDNQDHWLIKRFVQNGKVINSTTETIAPKNITKANGESEKEIPGAFAPENKAEELEKSIYESRTCNSCIGGKIRTH